MKKRYAIVGVGSRGFSMFARPLATDYADVAEIAAFCDPNQHRMDLANRELGLAVPTFKDFIVMMSTARPDGIIVTSIDATHHEYIIRGLEAGCEVISEKPMTTTDANVRAILDAERRTGHKIKVSFNARYGAETEELKRQLNAGTVGTLYSVDFAEFLDTEHGADYFRRWHRRKANSGGLLIHKATHHFDQLNWWIGADPETVFAFGATRCYGPTRAQRGERCLTCQYAGTCEYYLDLRANEHLKALYLDAEAEDGYFRDRCVFADDIDAEDTMVVTVRYENGVLLNYSLDACMPYEGQRIGLNGTKGRMEVDTVDRYHGLDADGHVRVLPLATPRVVKVNPLFGKPYQVPIPERKGTHGGADARIRDHLFRADTPDPLGQRADSHAGAMSVLIGVAANRSIATGEPVAIRDLLHA